jgi:hypothetical protein
MTAFCTYFDRNYIPQGLALYRSLIRTRPSAELWILCLDDAVASIIASLRLPGVRIVSVDDLIGFEPRLRDARENRPALEFFYACTPQLMRYVGAEAGAAAGGVAYIDADVYLYRDPMAIYTEAPGAEILLMEHRSGDPGLETQRGRFNVCFVHIASTPEADRALDWWGERTLESTAMDEETWGDQKYLDQFPELFRSVGILRSPAATLAPWNVWQHVVTNDVSGQVSADGRPLIAYHFARLLVVGPHLFSPARREWLPREVLRLIYRPYAREIRQSFSQIRSVAPDYSVGHNRKNRRGLILGLLAGRVFYEGRFGLHRLGVYVPNTRKEFRAWGWVMRRRLSGAHQQA